MPSFSFLPNQTRFFDLFEQAGDNLLEGTPTTGFARRLC